jgi:hypothetical protein
MPGLEFLFMDAENRLILSADFLTKFSSHQTLSTWYLHGNISIPSLPASGFSVQTFHTLTFLSFLTKKETSILQYTPLFLIGKFPRLREMRICFWADHAASPTKAWHDFFRHLRSATTNSLCIIDVTIGRPRQVTFEDIPALQKFTLGIFRTTLFHSLSAGNLLIMFTRWPGLTQLCITGVVQVTIGFSALAETASHFPSLKYLKIQINCQIFPDVEDVPVLQHALNALDLSPLNLAVENRFALARCIDRTFPELADLTISGSEQFLKSGVGKDIQGFYKGLQSARKDQKMRDKFSTSSMSHKRSP